MPVFDPIADLTSFITELPGDCHSVVLLDVLRRTRQVLEKDGLRSTYPTLAMYCDWHHHNEINRHESAWDILLQIGSLLCDASSDPIKSIRQAVGITQLKEDLKSLFKSRNVPTFLLDDNDNWSAFVFFLLEALSFKRLTWPSDLKGKAKLAHDRLMQRVGRQDLYPREFYIESRLLGHEGPGFYWTVELSNGPHSARITGQLFPIRA